MPLVRRDPPGASARPAPTDGPNGPGGGAPEAADLGAALTTQTDPRLRETLLAALVARADGAAARALAAHLRARDAALRNACIEALQQMPAGAAEVLPDLLRDPDPDVRLLATEVARTQEPAAATLLLADLLQREGHPNVCGAAVEVLAEVGTAAAIPALRAARARFAAAAFLPQAIDTVLARLTPEP